MDIGGTNIKVGVVKNRKIIRRAQYRTDAGRSREHSIRNILNAVGTFADGVDAVGIGCAGIIDSEQGIVRFSPNFTGWVDVDLARRVADRFGKPVRLINDVNAILLGEYIAGAARGCRNVFLFTLGTGVGGAAICEGKLLFGAHGFAGEFGHTTVKFDGAQCRCGNRGCLEQYAGARSIVRLARRLMRRKKSRLSRGRVITPEVISDMARNGDPVACEVYARVGRIVGIGLGNIINLFDPELIIVAGGVASAGPILYRPMRETVKMRLLGGRYRRIRIRSASLGRDAGILGAACFASLASNEPSAELDF